MPTWCRLAVALLSGILGTSSEAAEIERPSIVVIVVDDLGWNEVGYHGSEIPTPNIDRLADEGVELDRFYVQPLCSPTRAGLLTGRWPQRFGMMNFVVNPWEEKGLPMEEETLPEVLAGAGYVHRTSLR